MSGSQGEAVTAMFLTLSDSSIPITHPPYMSISRTDPFTITLNTAFTGPNKLILSWSSTATNLVIQTNGNVAGANWGTASYPVTITNGTNQSVTITPAAGNMFFRLKQ
jgi:hypothetical protein